ncbi:MAG: enoyl-CoA hydratase-related protein [bacterium]|nr:enoyl-CoA hydratase-related protein [bacterium]
MAEEKFAGGKLILRREGPIATVVLNHPEKMNAIELEMWAGLGRILPRLEKDDTVRVLVFRGAGVKAFSAGADISRFKSERFSSAQARAYAENGFWAVDAIEAFSKPTLSLIEGACVGGGAELASSTDIRIAGESSRFGVPTAKLGLVAGHAELRRFLNIIGPARTLEMLYTARLFSAQEMLAAGFLSRVVPDAEVEKTVYETAGRIASLAPLVHHWHKRFIRKILSDPSLSDLTEEEIAEQFACFDTADFREGVSAFLEKRTPQFKGE